MPPTSPQLSRLFQGQISTVNGVAALKAQWHDAIQTEKTLRTQMALVSQGSKSFVIQNFPGNAEALADVGFTAKRAA